VKKTFLKTGTAGFRLFPLALAAAVFAGLVALYLPIFTGPAVFIGDDRGYIYDNAYPDGNLFSRKLIGQNFVISDIEYNPFTRVTFVADKALWGFNPTGFRFTNLVIFFLIALAVFSLCRDLNADKAPWDDRSLWLACAAAVGFVVLHPVQVESVCSISSRKELLYVLFGLLALRAYTRRPDTRASLAASMVFLLMAQLSKGTAFVIPLIFVSYELFYRKLWQKVAVRVRPLFLSFAVSWPIFAYQLYVALQRVVTTDSPGIPPGGRIAGVARILHIVITRFFVPGPISYEYEIRWPASLNIGAQWILPALLALIATYALRRKWYVFLFMLCAILLPLGPYLNIIPIRHGYRGYMVHYDHYLLMPFVAASMLLARGILKAARWKGSLLIVMLACVAFFAYQDNVAAGYWKTRETLYRRCIETAPDMPRGYLFLGLAYNDLGRSGEAIPVLEKGRLLDPGDMNILKALGNAYAFSGRYADAEKAYVQYLAGNPADEALLQNLSNTLIMLNKFAEARRIIRRWIALAPGTQAALSTLEFSFKREAQVFGR
jgi:hypothetical protein